MSAARAPAPATRGSPPSTRCFASPRSSIPSTRRSSSACSRSPSNGSTGTNITYLTEPEIAALLAVPDRASWSGRRDHTLLLRAVQTELRASELTGLDCGDVHLGTGAHLSCRGKGRKDRATPLTTSTAASLRAWLEERQGQPTDPLNRTAGQPPGRYRPPDSLLAFLEGL